MAKDTTCTQKKINKWYITQEHSIREQLNLGIRALDLNVVCVKDIYWISYDYICVTLEEVLDDIQNFIQMNSAEVILIKLKYEYKMTGSQRVRLWDEHLGAYMYSYQDKFSTYGQMIFRRKSLLVFCNHEHYWPTSRFSLIKFAHTDPYAIVQEVTQWADEFHNYYDRVFGLTYALDNKEKYSKSTLHRRSGSLSAVNAILLDSFEEINVLLFNFPTEEIIQTMIRSNLE